MALKTMVLKDKSKAKVKTPAIKTAKGISEAKAKVPSGAQESGVKKKRLATVKGIAKAK